MEKLKDFYVLFIFSSIPPHISISEISFCLDWRRDFGDMVFEKLPYGRGIGLKKKKKDKPGSVGGN